MDSGILVGLLVVVVGGVALGWIITKAVRLAGKGFRLAGQFVWKAWQKKRPESPWQPAPKHGAADGPLPDEGLRDAAAWLRVRLAPLFSKAVGAAKGLRNPFVFYNRFGLWPVVRRPLDGKPGNFIMYAPCTGPRRVRFVKWKAPVLTGVALALLWWGFYAEPYRPGPNDLPLPVVLAEVAVFLGLPTVPLWWTVLRRNWFFTIRFIDGKMIWRGADAIWRKRRIPADAVAFEGMIHRLAEKESREQANWRASHRGQAPPKPLFQTSSEVVAMVSNRPWMTVAEFANDPGQERALRLVRALRHVRAAAVTEWRAGKRIEEQAGSRKQDDKEEF